MKKITEIAQELVLSALVRGSCAVDATVGNGNDTLFLARNVGPDGLVVGLDVQMVGLMRARESLKNAGVLNRTNLICDSHENLERHVRGSVGGRAVMACMFNLGYLPGSDKRVITTPASTLKALGAATRLLAVGGVVSVIAYTGHRGGAEEAASVRDWTLRLSPKQFSVSRIVQDANALAPQLTIITSLAAR